MINVKLSALVSGGAFMLSLIIGLLSGAGIAALVRALILGAAFFLVTGGAYWLIVKFLPELLSPLPEDQATEAGAPPGAQVDISLGEEEPEPVFGEGAIFPEDDTSGMDQIDTIGYTQGGEVDGGPSVQQETLAEQPADVPMPEGPSTKDPSGESLPGARSPGPVSYGKPAVPEDPSDRGLFDRGPADLGQAGRGAADQGSADQDLFDLVDELPDMDTLASAFTSSNGSEPGDADRVLPLDIAQRKGEPRVGGGKLDHDYSTHDMAAAIQTILKRD
jgi:hypothetical protein